MKNKLFILTILLPLAGLIFYLIYPKYHFVNAFVRCNKITGETQHLTAEGVWVDFALIKNKAHVEKKDREAKETAEAERQQAIKDTSPTRFPDSTFDRWYGEIRNKPAQKKAIK